MAPSKAIITKTCRAIVDETFNGPDRESLTIRFVRNKVEEKLGFEEGFLLRDEWKALSKQIIKEYVVSRATSALSVACGNLWLRMN